MEEDLIEEGTAHFHPSLDTPAYTYYWVYGNLKSGTPPLIALHGGPGAGHTYMEPFAKLWKSHNVPVVLYDQIGCAKSSHHRDKAGDYDFWKVDMFADELENLIKYLQIADEPGYYVLGHSWGGTVAARFASRQPRGLIRLVLASASSDGQLFQQGIEKLKRQWLPVELQQAIDEAREKGDFTSKAYIEAMRHFRSLFLCRADPQPRELEQTAINQTEDSTVRITVQGPSPWMYTGVLKTWSSIPFAHQINVPTLMYHGEFDTSQDEVVAPWFNNIPRIRWVTIAGASHMPHLDSPELLQKTLKLIGEFLLAHGEVHKSGG